MWPRPHGRILVDDPQRHSADGVAFGYPRNWELSIERETEDGFESPSSEVYTMAHASALAPLDRVTLAVRLRR